MSQKTEILQNPSFFNAKDDIFTLKNPTVAKLDSMSMGWRVEDLVGTWFCSRLPETA